VEEVSRIVTHLLDTGALFTAGSDFANDIRYPLDRSDDALQRLARATLISFAATALRCAKLRTSVQSPTRLCLQAATDRDRQQGPV
jgi:hypothetical protein